MGLRERKREATRKAIITAATTLFTERDYDAVTVDEIAAAAEVAKGTVYNYFPSKEHVAAAVANAAFQEGSPAAEELLAGGTTAIDILKILFKAGAVWAEQNPRLAQVTLSHVLRQVFSSDALCGPVEGYSSLFSLALRMIEMGQATGQIRRDLSATEMAQTLALLHAQTLWFWTVTPEEPPTQRMSRCVQTWLEGAMTDNT